MVKSRAYTLEAQSAEYLFYVRFWPHSISRKKKKSQHTAASAAEFNAPNEKKKRNLRLIHCQPNSTQSVCSQITKTLPVRRGKTNYAKYKHAPVYFVCFF